MGLDGLPSPQSIHKQQRKLSDNKRNEKPLSHQFNKKTTIEQQQFKDVYEDPEASHSGNHHYPSPPNSKRRSTKQEFGYIQERCDEVLRESIAFKSKLERVDSNSDLMLTFLQKPDSLFVKHLHDQQSIPHGSLCNQITVLKPSNSVMHGSKKEEKETLIYRHRRSSRILERKDDIALSPTRIVVLKPNLAKIHNDRTYVLHSPEMYKGPLGEVRSSRHKSREAREIAKQITSQMKEGFECGDINLFHSGYRGYDDMDEFDRPRRSPMSESSVIREAKKRMSQRWKTHGYKDANMIGKGSTSTLEEMLSVPNTEMRQDDDIINGEYLRSSTSKSRSRSVPPSFNNRSHKTSDYHEAHSELKNMVHNEQVHRFKNKEVKSNFNHREDSRSKNVRYTKRCNACSPEFDDYLPECHSTRKPTEQDLLISNSSNIYDPHPDPAITINEERLISQVWFKYILKMLKKVIFCFPFFKSVFGCYRNNGVQNQVELFPFSCLDLSQNRLKGPRRLTNVVSFLQCWKLRLQKMYHLVLIALRESALDFLVTTYFLLCFLPIKATYLIPFIFFQIIFQNSGNNFIYLKWSRSQLTIVKMMKRWSKNLP